ncbi:MAG TPA: patatin-like phospholipase family protein [Terriglobia bacterium]
MEAVLASVDELRFDHATLLVFTSPQQTDLTALLNNMERVFLVGNPFAISQAAARCAGERPTAAIPLTASADNNQTLAGLPVPRAIRPSHPDDLEWLGRHLARTKLGVALGGGGAKGFAHIGVMQVLEETGHPVDYLAGSSAGTLVGALLAMGLSAAEAAVSIRRHMNPENVAILMKGMLGGAEPLQLMIRLLREMTQDCTFADLKIPMVILTVDLDTRRPYPIRSGLVWEAVLASSVLPGMFPPYILDGRRLIDGAVMAPVPTSYVMEAGADVTLGIDILSGNLPAWPGDDPPNPDASRRTMNIIEALVDTMVLGYADASARHAAMADVAVTPQFGPSSYKDFDMADRFVAAGREAAHARLSMLERYAPSLTRRAEHRLAEHTRI